MALFVADIACNIFCCNCASGCNRSLDDYWRQNGHYRHNTCGHKKRKILINTNKNDSLEADMLFKSIDINGDNVINNEEASSYLETGTKFK